MPPFLLAQQAKMKAGLESGLAYSLLCLFAMSIQFRNVNTVWASVLVETLARLGLTTALICPGSRSAPLAVAFAQHPTVEAIPILDERSAAFWAVGSARRGRTGGRSDGVTADASAELLQEAQVAVDQVGGLV